MATDKSVVIVSAFGRGQWLASQLAQEGFQVHLVDVMSQLGRWAPEDWEGPFGFFRSDELLPNQVARLVEDDPQESVDRGFTIWLRDGPIELKGPLYNYSLQMQGVSELTQAYLLEYESLSDESRIQRRRKLQKQVFSENWLAHLAHQLSCNIFIQNAEALSESSPMPLFSQLFIRRTSRFGYEKSLSWCEQKGVHVDQDASVIDMAIKDKRVEGLEVSGPRSRWIKTRHLIWMLTSEETQRFKPPVKERVFPKGAIESEWCWIRFRLNLGTGSSVQVLPLKFLMIENLYLPWTHANLCIVQRTVTAGDFDIWIRFPTAQRFHRPYLDEMLAEISLIFKKRLVGVDIRVVEMPYEYDYNYQEIGAPRFPIYSKTTLGRLNGSSIQNIYYDGPERWKRLDWGGQLGFQASLLKQVCNQDLLLKDRPTTVF